MARIRTIKPEFPQSESMGNVSRDARLLFVLLWTICDDEGKSRGNSRMLASLLFPYDDDAPAMIDSWMSELEEEGCVVRYQSGGSTYLQVLNWLNHQKIDKPSKSKIPDFDESSRILANPRESSSLDQGSKDQGVDQGSGPCSAPPATPATPPKKSEPVETDLQAACREVWKAYGSAYFDRYGTEPVRNTTVSSQVKTFVQRIGRTEAPLVAAFYVSHPGQFYVKNMHQFGHALKDAEKLRTEWATRRVVTDTQARHSDRMGANMSAADEAMRILEGEVIQ